MASGDALKVSAEVRPLVIEWLREFDVECSRDERARASKISDQVSDYDPAGKFAYMLYAAVLALGDESMDDLVVYHYYMGTLGQHADESDDSYIAFLNTVREVASVDMQDVKKTKLRMATDNITFEEFTVRSIRTNYLKSPLFDSAIDGVTKEMSDALLGGISTKPKRFTRLAKEIQKELRKVCEAHMDTNDYEMLISVMDSKMPLDDSVDRAMGLLNDSPELEALMKAADIFSDLMGDDAETIFGTGSFDNIAESMVLIHRATVYLTALFTTIGTGKLGLDGNKRLAYAIKEGLRYATDRTDRELTNVLKLEKQTTPDLFISLN